MGQNRWPVMPLRHDGRPQLCAITALPPGGPSRAIRVSEASSTDRPAAAASPRREHVPLAILYMVGATMMFAASSAASKWLVERYPVGEVLFTRTAVSLVVCAAFILPRSGLSAFRTRRFHHHLLRSV